MSIMHCHKHDQQFDSDLGDCPECDSPDELIADLMNGEERLSNVVEDLRRQMFVFADAVKRLAFEMPPPNEYTPKFVQMALDAELIARRSEAQRLKVK